MRLVFISSVTAITPLRMISTITGSIFARSCARFGHMRWPPTVISRLPWRSTVSVSPGNTTVVDACSSTSAGPSIRLPDLSRAAAQDARLDKSARLAEEHKARGAACVGIGLGRSLGDGLEARLQRDPDHRGAQTDDLGRLAGRAGAVAQFVEIVEALLDPGAILRLEQGKRQVEGDGMLLSDITHVRRAPDDDLRGARSVLGDGFLPFIGHRSVFLFDGSEIHVGEAHDAGMDEIVAEVREQHAGGGEMPGRRRDQHLPDADLARDERRVQRPRAAIDKEGEGARVESALGRHRLHRIGHGGGGNAQDAVRRFRGGQPKRRSDLVHHGALGRGFVEPHLAAEEMSGVEPAEQQIGVGHRGFAAAEAIARGPRRGAGALGTDTQRLAVAQPCDAAAAGADLENVHHRDLDRQGAFVSADQRAARGERLALEDDAGLGAGAAHVEGDHVVEADRATHRARADHARSRARFQHADAILARLVARRRARPSIARRKTSRRTPRGPDARSISSM